MSDEIPRVLAVCTVHADLEMPTRVGRTAIDKRPRPGRVEVRALGLEGDHVCDTEHHGGLNQAVYAYAEQDARRWGEELGRELPAGWFGENLRIDGLAVSDAVLAARWAIGETLLEVSAPRVPCATFGHRSGEEHRVAVAIRCAPGGGDAPRADFCRRSPSTGHTERRVASSARCRRLRVGRGRAVRRGGRGTATRGGRGTRGIGPDPGADAQSTVVGRDRR